MFKFVQSLIVFLNIFVYNAFAEGGGMVGNGGNAVVCNDSSGKMISAELLDLYEGRVLYGLKYTESAIDHLQQAITLALKIDTSMGTKNVDGGRNFTADDVIAINKRARMLPSGTGLTPVNDSFHFIVPKNCSIIQVATYRNNDEVFIDSDIWSLLTETNKAGLLLHEALYHQLRYGADQTSVRTRKAVSLIINNTSFDHVYLPVQAKSKIQSCYTFDAWENGRPSSYFSSYIDQQNRVILQFSKIAGFEMIARSFIQTLPDRAYNWPLSSSTTQGFTNSGNLISIIDSDMYLSIYYINSILTLEVRLSNGLSTRESLLCDKPN